MSLLGVDVGTSACKAAAFAEDGRRLSLASRDYGTLHPRPGQAELDSHEVWRKTREVIAEAAAGAGGDPVTAVCAGSMGEAVVPVSRDREILGRSILCSDVRGAGYASALEAEVGREALYRINPNRVGPQYSLPKILWLRDHEPELFRRADRFLLWGDLVGHMLGCEPFASNSLANRTLLLDVGRNDWSGALLAWSGLERARFGRVVPGGTVVGRVADAAAAELGLARGAAVVSGGHDQCCNALGCGAIEAGKAVCGIGTYECITPVFREVRDPLAMLGAGLNIEHHVLPGLYVAFLFNQAGALVKWFRDTFAAADTAAAGEAVYDLLNAELPPGPTRLLVLPHFDPPLWPEYVGDTAGAIVGLRTDTRRGEILKAIMECTTLYFVAGIEALRRMGVDLTEFIASGGGARSDAWLQIKADVLGIPFVRPRISEAGLAGAAMLAGLATGAFASPAEAARAFVARDRVFEPDPARHGTYREKRAVYERLFPSIRDVLKAL
jgi:xylulokinase